MKTTYTVDESVGSVSVCVNLTQPQVDILDDTVNVDVIDYPSSVYVPPGATLASKPSNLYHCVCHIMHSQLLILPTFSVDT